MLGLWYSHCLSTQTSNLCVHRKHSHGPETERERDIRDAEERPNLCAQSEFRRGAEGLERPESSHPAYLRGARAHHRSPVPGASWVL
jgi:hypothetical protein